MRSRRSPATHGEAVAIGMVKAVDLGVKLGETPEGVKERILAVLEKWHLPTTTDLPVEELFHTMCSDKKKLNGKIYYVMINNIGESKTRPLSRSRLLTAACLLIPCLSLIRMLRCPPRKGRSAAWVSIW